MTLKEKIVHESLRLFSLKGFASTSINDILSATNASKGGFYNHFASKEDLFYATLHEARAIWRERTLSGLREIASPFVRLEQLLRNYRDRYLKDAENFPGGCIFVTFSVELDNQLPHLSQEVNKGFVGFKALLKRILDEAKDSGELSPDSDTGSIAEILLAGMLGASVIYGLDKSVTNLDHTINALIDNLKKHKLETTQKEGD